MSMKKRADLVRELNDEELGHFLCSLFQDCPNCPVCDECHYGSNGFIKWIKGEDDGLDPFDKRYAE